MTPDTLQCGKCGQVKLLKDFRLMRLRISVPSVCRACTFKRNVSYMKRRKREYTRVNQDQRLQQILAAELNKVPDRERLKQKPKHPCVRRIKQIQRHQKRKLFWYLPPDLRKQALAKYEERLEQLKVEYAYRGQTITRMTIVGMIGGITKMLLYPEQKLVGKHSELSGRAKRGWKTRLLNQQREMRNVALKLQDESERRQSGIPPLQD